MHKRLPKRLKGSRHFIKLFIIMGLFDMDNIVSFAIGKAEDKLQGEEKQEKTTVGGFLLRFIVSLVWLIITLVASVIAFLAMVGGSFLDILGNEDGKPICILAIGLCLLVFFITFLIPYLRKKGTLTRWCGIVALGDAAWWIYLLISGF